MNLKGFKKVKDEKDKAVLVNQRGHQITLAKKQLSKSHLENLERLPLYSADGNMIEEESNVNLGAMPQRDIAQIPQSDVQLPGGDLEPLPQDPPMQSIEQAEAAPQQWSPQMARQQRNAMPQPAPQAQPRQQGLSAPSPVQDYQKAYKDQVAQSAAMRGKQDAMWAQDLSNGHVQAKTYSDLFNDKSTLGKIGTVFGLLLSGAGSGLAHQTNAALEMMNNEIKNDLDAQKTSKSNAMNYFKANLEQQKTQAEVGLLGAQSEHYLIQNAYDKSMNQMRIAALQKLFSMTNNMPPDKRAQMMKTLNETVAPAVVAQNEKDNLRAAEIEQGFKQRQNLLSQAETLGALPGGRSQAEYEMSRHLPMLPGEVATIPFDKSDRMYLNSAEDFDKQLNQFISWSKAHSGDLNESDRRTGKALAAELQAAYRQATNGGVFKEGEQNFISKIIDSEPTKFFNQIRTLPQLDVLVDENRRRMDSKIKSHGMSGYPKHKRTKWVGGVEYEEGPNGEAVPVKKGE